MNELPDSPSVAAAVEQLTAVANAPNKKAARDVMEAFLDDAESTDEKLDTAFLAVQLVRDLGVLDEDEAGLVFHSLAATRAAVPDIDASAAVQFHRDRGEDTIATMIEVDPERYDKWIREGSGSLLHFDIHEEEPCIADTPRRIAMISERAAALVSSIAGSEREAAWNDLRYAMKGVAADGRVRAVRALRDVGMLSVSEYAALVDAAMSDRYWARLSADRQARRESKADVRAYIDEAARPGPSRFLKDEPRAPDRRDRVRASCLREIGEHDLANLLLANSAAYRKQMDERFARGPYEWDVERGNEAALRENDRELLRREEDDHQAVMRYAKGMMGREELIVFEERLMADKAFFNRLMPDLANWISGRPVPPRVRRRIKAWRRKEKWRKNWYERMESMKWRVRHWFG